MTTIGNMKYAIEASKHRRQRLFVDMDGTLTEFLPQKSTEPLYQKGYFYHLPPQDNVVAAVRDLTLRHPEIEVFILSAYLVDSPYALAEKNAWVDRYLPEIDRPHRIFVPNGSDKKEWIGGMRKDDVLLDDYTQNLLRWQPLRGIKLINAINHTRRTWQGEVVYYHHTPCELAQEILFAMGRVGTIITEAVS